METRQEIQSQRDALANYIKRQENKLATNPQDKDVLEEKIINADLRLWVLDQTLEMMP
mgnify:CR=1 FL=1